MQTSSWAYLRKQKFIHHLFINQTKSAIISNLIYIYIYIYILYKYIYITYIYMYIFNIYIYIYIYVYIYIYIAFHISHKQNAVYYAETKRWKLLHTKNRTYQAKATKLYQNDDTS